MPIAHGYDKVIKNGQWICYVRRIYGNKAVEPLMRIICANQPLGAFYQVHRRHVIPYFNTEVIVPY
jgi:hypothetical protein